MKKEDEAKTIKDTGLLREPLLDCTNRQNVKKKDCGSVMNKNAKGQWKRMARMQSARRNQYDGKDQDEMDDGHRKRERIEQDPEIEIQEGIVVVKKKKE